MLLMGFFPFMTGPVLPSLISPGVPELTMPEDKIFALWLLLQKGWVFPRSWVSLPASCGHSRHAGVPQILQVTHFWAVESESRSFLPINGSFDNSWKAEGWSNLESWQLCSVSVCYKSSIFHLVWVQRNTEAPSPGSQSQTDGAPQRKPKQIWVGWFKTGSHDIVATMCAGPLRQGPDPKGLIFLFC